VKKVAVGQIYVNGGVIDENGPNHAPRYFSTTGKQVGEAFVDTGLANDVTVAKAVAQQMGLHYIDLMEVQCDDDVATLIPEEMARRYRAIAVERAGSRLRVAMADPLNVVAIDDLRMATNLEIEPLMALESQVLEIVNQTYRLEEVVEKTLREVSTEKIAETIGPVSRPVEAEAPIVRLVNTIITQAVRQQASDVHIDPQETEVRVRFRVDGVLSDFMRLPKRVVGSVISRIKVMAGMDIGERRLPQDGRCTMLVEGRDVDLRVATMPTVHGEKATIRILDKSAALLRITSLGMDQKDLERFRAMTHQPYGMVLVTGPTGSGKTTTLYAALVDITDTEKHIITMEDPVEYHLKGINQISVNRKAGLVFAAGLRSILRLDPDIILVGEIRDGETAEIAVQSALTGHLVLSTLHTNDASGALTRLVEMGIEPFLVASSVIGVMAQRLVRKVCSHCAEPQAVPEQFVEAILNNSASMSNIKDGRFVKAKGCIRCSNMGYKGRLAITEVLTVSAEVRTAVLQRKSSSEIETIARSQGMATLLESGVMKAMESLTTIDEVLRVARL
jgi:type IV pilus assembly protein PilB